VEHLHPPEQTPRLAAGRVRVQKETGGAAVQPLFRVRPRSQEELPLQGSHHRACSNRVLICSVGHPQRDRVQAERRQSQQERGQGRGRHSLFTTYGTAAAVAEIVERQSFFFYMSRLRVYINRKCLQNKFMIYLKLSSHDEITTYTYFNTN
jgi:hypothetical protein